MFSHWLINGTIFGREREGGEKLNIKRVFFSVCPQLLSETFLIIRRIQRDSIINVHRSSCDVPVIVVRF
jgi:hypothetical protein